MGVSIMGEGFVIAVTVVTVVTFYGVACGIQWAQYPDSAGYSRGYRVGQVLGQAAVCTVILAIVAALGFVGMWLS